jgi:uncharacterized protein
MVTEVLYTKRHMHIQHEESDIRGRHFINDEKGNMLAEITYAVRHPDTMVVDHTEVSEELKGKNIGKQLVEAVVEHARAKGRKIIAVCPFTRSVLEKSDQYKDVISHQSPETQDRQYDPARVNDHSPAPGMASVNTHNPDEEESKKSNRSNES